MSTWFIGVDLGQKNDPTAVAVLQRFVSLRAHQSPLLQSLNVLHVERLPLGAPYPRVVDMLRAARLNCDISPVNITGGDQQSRSGKTWNVPKRDLLASLQLPLEHGQLKLAPNLKLMSSLIREFTDFRSTTNSSGHVRLGADGSGEHDDLVIAIALACWRAQRREVSGDAPDRPFNSSNMYNSVEDYDPVLRFHTRR